ncbi:MAG: VIT domain-containing protein [Elusimicrobiota bacterium]|nr:VIT domain-containing protein [Elusimicrobiota bacterium]
MDRHRPALTAVAFAVIGFLLHPGLKPFPSDPASEPASAQDAGSTFSLVPSASAQEFERVSISSSDMPSGGLMAFGGGKKVGPFVLEHTEASVEVAGGFAFVEVSQRFKNPHASRLEAVYAFPLPENAAVTDMFMRVSSRVVASEVHEREQAKRIYETAKSSGQTAALLEQERPNLFTQSVANVPPGETVFVHIRYVHELAYDQGRYRFVFPMTVGPRFNPPSVADAERVTPPMLEPGERGGHDIQVTVKLKGGLPVTGLKSLSHELIVKKSSGATTVRLKDFDTIPNKDLMLEWGLSAAKPEVSVLSHKSSSTGTVLLTLQPQARPRPEEVTPKEMVFVVDTSGSMSGEPIAKVKEAMRRAIKGMNPGDSFQIIRFDQAASSFRPLPVANTPQNVRDGLSYLNGFDGAGGTNMIEGIKAALDFPRDPARRRVVLFMTDGYIGNETEIFAAVRERLGETRLFSFGVGSSVNRYLLDGLAKEGRGFVQYVRPDQETEKAVALFYKRIRNPLLMDVAIDWGGLAVTDFEPKVLPDLFDGQPLTVLARYSGPSTGTVTVTGKIAGKPYRRTLGVRLPGKRTENRALPVVWARRRVERLKGETYGAPKPETVEEVKGIGLSFKLVTPYTSFVAVERTLLADSRLPLETVLIPNEMPEGMSWEANFGKDAALVSIPRMKPGDPVLSVDAPRGTAAVIADFPFGKRQLCAWDEVREKWACRFLVPRGTPDGRYAIKVLAVGRDGSRAEFEADYEVDSKAPVFEVAAKAAGREVLVMAEPRRFVLETRKGRKGALAVTHDVKRVRLLTADGKVTTLRLERRPDRFVWSAKVAARGKAVLEAVDYAGNVSRQEVVLP